jgi:purine-binding chemotaxis protein CheW
MITELEQSRERKILEARARALAATPSATDGGRAEMSIVIVEGGGERVGIPCQNVREISRCPRVTRLPGVPAWCRGLLQIRGEAMTAVDLGAFLSLRPVEAARFVVTVAEGPRAVALLIEGVVGLREVHGGDLVESIRQRDAPGERAIRSTTKDLVSILDVDGLLSQLQVGGARDGDPTELPSKG